MKAWDLVVFVFWEGEKGERESETQREGKFGFSGKTGTPSSFVCVCTFGWVKCMASLKLNYD